MLLKRQIHLCKIGTAGLMLLVWFFYGFASQANDGSNLVSEGGAELAGDRPECDICAFLGGRNDKNFLGSGNIVLVVDSSQTRFIFVQLWKAGGIFDWASCMVRSWLPDCL